MKKIIIVLLILAVLGTTGYFIFNAAGCKQKEKIAALEDRINELQAEYVPIRFKILNRENGNIRAALKFYDADGKVINRTTKILEGRELSVDFYVIPVKDKYLAFPVKIFTDKIATDNGESLTELYDKEGFPQIFFSKNLDKKLMGGLELIFTKIKEDNYSADDKYFGNMVHDIPQLKAYKIGEIYRIVCRTKGGIEVIQE